VLAAQDVDHAFEILERNLQKTEERWMPLLSPFDAAASLQASIHEPHKITARAFVADVWVGLLVVDGSASSSSWNSTCSTVESPHGSRPADSPRGRQRGVSRWKGDRLSS
jgi:hypothetical protein